LVHQNRAGLGGYNPDERDTGVDVVRELFLKVFVRVVLGNLPALLFLLWQQNASLLFLIPTFVLLVIVGCIVTRTLSQKDVVMARFILFTGTSKMSSKKIDITEQPTVFVPSVYEIADQETLILPRIQL